ncbi:MULTISPECIES: hypothetical protein [Streptomyces]|uniref:hypothetical protein n=1 Tax=Streptomyces TaxID=1883 RepID=UPI001F201C74|nr:hypothetical protein [Streptomyces sp. A1-5]UJB44561.1 hypothetical protein HRD51_30585 [Streptomyces sp. A1-5]
MHKLMKSAAMAATTAAVALGSLAATAPTASADGSVDCTRDDRNRTVSVSDISAAIHEEPYVDSRVIGHAWTQFTVQCSRPGRDGHRWWWGYGGSDGHTTGWIWGGYLQG